MEKEIKGIKNCEMIQVMDGIISIVFDVEASEFMEDTKDEKNVGDPQTEIIDYSIQEQLNDMSDIDIMNKTISYIKNKI